MVSIMGPSGSGKSTLLAVLSGLQVPDSGSAVVMGTNIASLSEDQRASHRLRHVGVVFQDHNLVPQFTALENVLVPLRARGVPQAEAEAKQSLALVGLEGLESRRPAELSGGQQQRVGIARSLAGGRSVILADEPTGALDSTTSAELMQLLRSLADLGTTVVVVTHDASVAAWADRHYGMLDGALTEVPSALATA